MTREEAIEIIRKYFEENEEEFTKAIEELDSHNGFLGDDRCYEMEMIDEFYHGVAPSELMNRIFYGYDADTSYSDEHRSHYEEFNPNRAYFYYNGYGNLVSTDYLDYSDKLDDYFVEAYIEMGVVDNEEMQEVIDSIEE